MPEDSSPSLLLKPAEVAEHLRVSVRTAQRLIENGDIEKVHVGVRRATRVRRSALEAYVDRLESGKSGAA